MNVMTMNKSNTSFRLRESLRSPRRGGFTLLELLVVIAVIAIISAIFLGALSAAQRLSQTTNTKSIIQKLHNALMSRWDAYRSVRLPINAEGRGGNGTADASNERASKFRQDVARRKMLATRELLRMEMPDRYEDLQFTPVYLVSTSNKPVRPFLWSSYQRRIVDTKNRMSALDPSINGMSIAEYVDFISRRFQSAECLYMIMMLGTEDSSTSTEHFSGKDIGDVDNDGMYEFIDAWGTPIEFLRWAPGFYSPMQPIYSYPYPGPANSPGSVFHSTQPRDPNNGNNVVSHWKVQFESFTNTNSTINNVSTVGTKIVIIDQDDPFNPMRVGPVKESSPGSWVRSTRWRPGDPGPEHGFILIPLIYSCGPDQRSGINHCFNHTIETDDLENDIGYTIKDSPTAEDKEGKSSGAAHIKFSDPYNIYKNDKNEAGVYRGSTRGDGRSLDNVTSHDLGTK